MFARKNQLMWVLACSFAGVATHLWNLDLNFFPNAIIINSSWSNLLRNKHNKSVLPRHESSDDGECIPMHDDSKEHSHPNGNVMHELDFFSKYIDGEIKYLAHGAVNDVYRYKDEPTGKSLVVKISESDHRTVSLDSTIMDRLTKSPHIVDVYGYCGHTLILPFAGGGTFGRKMQKWRNGEVRLDSMTRLQYALNMTRALRDLHDIHGDNVPSVIHGDLKAFQYLFDNNGRLILGDFNKGQFLTKSSTSGKPCTYKLPRIGTMTLFRAPEEYSNMQQSAASDVFELGSLLYNLITGDHVWHEWLSSAHERKEACQMIIDGKRPKIKRKIRENDDPVNVALMTAYDMCTRHNPEERSSAKEVSDYLENVWNELN
eukprot:scaffold36344_cov56-Cyclotella_meneghiniana.AAC.5